jgi:hypothetical protein
VLVASFNCIAIFLSVLSLIPHLSLCPRRPLLRQPQSALLATPSLVLPSSASLSVHFVLSHPALSARSPVQVLSLFVMSLSKQISLLWSQYLNELDRNPVQTKSLTSAVLSVVSDVLAQTLTGKSLSTLDYQSLRHQFVLGLLFRGPLVHYWYTILEEAFKRLGFGPGSAKGESFSVAVGKVVADQTLFSPLFNVAYFFAIGALQSRPLASIQAQIAKEFLPIMMANYKVWPLVNLINFKVIPPNLRVLFGNLVGILWTAYVIKMTSGAKK